MALSGRGRGSELGTTENKSSKVVRTGLEPGRPRFLVRRADHSPVFRGVHICTTEWRGIFLVYEIFFHKWTDEWKMQHLNTLIYHTPVPLHLMATIRYIVHIEFSFAKFFLAITLSYQCEHKRIRTLIES